MPFEVTPFFPRLTRIGSNTQAAAAPAVSAPATDNATK